MARQLSEQAQVAKIARQFVKSLGLKVTARSSSFSMGDSVSVTVTNANPEQRDLIENELNQYQYGSFNGMEDIYESTNSRNDIPQTKYMQIQFDYTPDMEQAAYQWLKDTFNNDEINALPENLEDVSHNAQIMGEWAHSTIRMVLSGSFMNRVCGDITSFWDTLATPKQETPAIEKVEGDFAIEEHTHTKKGTQMFIVTLPSLEREQFNELRDVAKQMGGWYSRKWGNTPCGMAFNSHEEAAAFIAAVGNDEDGQSDLSGSQSTEETKASAMEFEDNNREFKQNVGADNSHCDSAIKNDGQNQRNGKNGANAKNKNIRTADKLEALADKLQPQIDAKLSTDRQTNTPKRMAQYYHAMVDGQRLERTQKAMRALASMHRDGTIPPLLSALTSKKAIFELMGAELEQVPNGFHSYYHDTGMPSKKDQVTLALWDMLDQKSSLDVKEKEIKDLENMVQFQKIDGYFPTPDKIIDRMMCLLGTEPKTFLEPSAGSGAIADFLRKTTDAAIECIELNYDLRRILELKGHNVLGHDFTKTVLTKRYDAILMNPPFEKMQDIDHVMRAFEFLHFGGELVAVMSAGITFRSDKKTVAFREFVEEQGGYIEELPAQSFKASGTSVSTCLVYLQRGYE